jgi:hypothetical protein
MANRMSYTTNVGLFQTTNGRCSGITISSMNISVFWVVTPCSLVAVRRNVSPPSSETYCWFPAWNTLRPEKSVGLYQTTRCYNPEGRTTPSLLLLRKPQIQRTDCLLEFSHWHTNFAVHIACHRGREISELWPGSDTVFPSYWTTAVTLLAIVLDMCWKLYGPSCDCRLRHLSLLVARLFTRPV